MSPEREEWVRRLVAEGLSGEHDDACCDWPWSTDTPGYAYTSDGSRMTRVSHIVLVQSGRLRPDPPQHHALHSCDRPLCCAPWHLRWGTNAENGREAYARGLRRPTGVALLRGEAVGHSRLTEDDVRAIRASYASGGVTQATLGKQYGVSQVTVGKITRGAIWRHVTTTR